MQQQYRHDRPQVDRGRGSTRVDTKHVEVYDIDIAAWLHLHRVPIVDAQRSGRETVITFYDPEGEDRVTKLLMEWLNSDAARYASAVRQIKKVSYSAAKTW